MNSSTERAPSLADIEVVHHFADGVYAKEMHIPKGYKVRTHSHARDHLSILGRGRALLAYGEGEAGQALAAGACVTVKKGVKHVIEALEDCVWFCIWPTEETDPARVDSAVIEKGSHAS